MKKNIKDLPKVWAIRQSSSKEVCEWFGEYFATSNASIGGSFIYLIYYLEEDTTTYSDGLMDNAVEITLDEFNECVLGIEPKSTEPAYEIY
jgi:hypothetical protein